VLGVPNLPGLAAFLAGDVYVTGTFSNPNAIFSDRITANNVIAKDVTLSGNLSARDVTLSGNLKANDVILAGADCAEEFDVAGVGLEPGTVAVLDANGALAPSANAYDKCVAGVVSGAGDYKPAIVLDRRLTLRPRAQIALVGKVYCKVDASQGRVEVGDLLTSSDLPGHAMRASDPARALGAIIGKALRPLASGQALLPILVALQ
jgi:hypothetical protein